MKIHKDLIGAESLDPDRAFQLVQYGYSRWIKVSKDCGEGTRVERNGDERRDTSLFTHIGGRGLGIYE